jgi:general secretion pathway protein H
MKREEGLNAKTQSSKDAREEQTVFAFLPSARGPSRRRRERGFTLIEIGAVLFVIVLIVGIAIPTIKTVSGMQAQTEISKLASNIRAARGHAAVAGETCRMVFDIGGSAYQLECIKGGAAIEKEVSKNGELQPPSKDKHLDLSEEQKKERLKLEEKRKFKPEAVLPSQKLTGNVEIVSVWTPHQTSTYTKGKASLYFFPSGTSEIGNIVLKYGDEFYTVQVASLAGAVKVIGDKAKLPEQDDFF